MKRLFVALGMADMFQERISFAADDAFDLAKTPPAPDYALGGWFYGRGDKPLPVEPRLVSARCDNGPLFIGDLPAVARHLPVLPGGNYHDYDYQLAYMNIRANAEVRVRAFLAKSK